MRSFVQKLKIAPLNPQYQLVQNHAIAPIGSLQLPQVAKEKPEVNSTSHALPGYSFNFSQIPLYASTPNNIQRKVKVNEPSDKFEQEADRVADQMLLMPESVVQRKCTQCTSGGPPCPKCSEEEKFKLQRKPESSATSDSSVPDNFISSLGLGQPLDKATRDYFEPRFGYDFSHVRVHSDAKASETAQAVNALAYTTGRDVVFGSGRYSPETREGRRLLAHELTHVVQQDQGNGITLQRQFTPQQNAPSPPPNGITIDVLDPLNSSIRIRDFKIPSPRQIMEGLQGLQRLGQPSPSLTVPIWPQPQLSETELREAACRALPSLCERPSILQLPPLQLSLPQFQPPRLIYHDSLTIDHFIYNEYSVPDRHRGTLDEKATEMIDTPSIVTDLTGHTDTRGDRGYNKRLSEQRAEAVKNYLIGRRVPKDQIWSVTGEGEDYPKYPNDDVDNLAASRNRRVEMLMRRLLWNWTIPFNFFLQPPRIGGLSIADPRLKVLPNERPQFDKIRNFIIQLQGEINIALAAGPVGFHALSRDNENVQAMLRVLGMLIGDLQSERYVVRFDQPLTSSVAASYDEQGDTIHIRPFNNNEEMAMVASSLLHEYAHAIQDRTAEQLLRAGRYPLEHTREEELRKETEARRHEVYFASLITALGHGFGASGFMEEVSAGVFVGRFEQERTGSPAEQKAARREIRSQLESAYTQQLAGAPSWKYLIEIRDGSTAVLVGQKAKETDLGSVPAYVATRDQLNAHLADRVGKSPTCATLFQGSGATKYRVAQFFVFEQNNKLSDFALTKDACAQP